jgi:1-deoxy-D-xylulose-5-phosphate synthase
MPNMVVMAPSNENELVRMLTAATAHDGPIALRYPRGIGTGCALDPAPRPLALGKAKVLRQGDDLLILAIGRPVNDAVEAASMLEADGLSATVVDCRFVKPLDVELILSLARKIPRIVTVEENVLQGGFGSAVIECLSDNGIADIAVKRVGIPDLFVEHGPQGLLRSRFGLDAEGIARTARSLHETVPR